MANSINVNIRVDEELKKQAEELFADMGLNMSTAVNMFLRQAVRTGGIPFAVTTRTDSMTIASPINAQTVSSAVTNMQTEQEAAIRRSPLLRESTGFGEV